MDKDERVAYADGGLRVVLRKGPYSTWQWRALDAPSDVLQVEAVILVEKGSGGGGPICGPMEGQEPWHWAGVNGDGEWLVGRIAGTHLQVAARGELPVVRDPEAPVGAPLPIAGDTPL